MQNKPLVESIFNKLSKNGFNVFLNRRVPSNDGGISLGQAYYGSFDDI